MLLIMLFFNFMFYRIMSAAMFDDPLTIWATALTAICVVMVQAFLGPIGLLYATDGEDGDERTSYLRLSGIVVVACSLSCIVAYLIALGFSARLFDDISYWQYRREFWEQDIFWFCIMISIPVFVHAVSFFCRLSKYD